MIWVQGRQIACSHFEGGPTLGARGVAGNAPLDTGIAPSEAAASPLRDPTFPEGRAPTAEEKGACEVVPRGFCQAGGNLRGE